jgi:hypothetical protein
LLFAGTETSIYVSFDDGANWERLSGNFPVTPVNDLIVKDDHLVVATHGRSFWVLDDLTPLREVAKGYVESSQHLFGPLDKERIRTYQGFGNAPTADFTNYRMTNPLVMAYDWKEDEQGISVEEPLTAGQNPPAGVLIHYLLPDEHSDEITLTVKDAQGNIVRTVSSEKPEAVDDKTPKPPHLSKRTGLNRFIWDMQYSPATAVPGDAGTRDYLDGPVAIPGRYSITLRTGETEQTAGFEILKDRRISATQEDLEAQFELLMRIRDLLDETNQTINALRDARQQVENWRDRLEKRDGTNQELVSQASKICDSLTEVELALIQPKSESSLQFPEGLNAKLAKLAAFVDMDDAKPTKQATEYFDWVSEQINGHLARYRRIVVEDINQLNGSIRQADVPLIITEH